MATLNVTNLQNTAATVTNVSLLADGTTTLVLNATGTSRLGGLRYNAGNLEVYTAGAVWVAAGGSTYTATAPIKVTGTVISVDLGLGVAANGANLALKVPVAATPPAIGTGAAQAFDGSMYWDDTLGQLFIRYINGGTSTWVAAAPPAGGVPAASLAEAAAGVTTVKYSSPATSVPKDAANMTGAAILPAGTDAQRAAITSPVAGMQRFNTTQSSMEYYDGTNWRGPYEFVQSAGWYGGSPLGQTQQFVTSSTFCTFNIEPITLTPGTWLLALNFYAAVSPNAAPGTYEMGVVFPYAQVGYGGYAKPNIIWISKPDAPSFKMTSTSNSALELDTLIALKVGPGNQTFNEIRGYWSNTGASDNGPHDLKINAWLTAMRID